MIAKIVDEDVLLGEKQWQKVEQSKVAEWRERQLIFQKKKKKSNENFLTTNMGNNENGAR